MTTLQAYQSMVNTIYQASPYIIIALFVWYLVYLFFQIIKDEHKTKKDV